MSLQGGTTDPVCEKRAAFLGRKKVPLARSEKERKKHPDGKIPAATVGREGSVLPDFPGKARETRARNVETGRHPSGNHKKMKKGQVPRRKNFHP